MFGFRNLKLMNMKIVIKSDNEVSNRTDFRDNKEKKIPVS